MNQTFESLLRHPHILTSLTLSWRRPLSYRNQSIYLLHKSVDWFLYDNSLRHERVNGWLINSEVSYLWIELSNHCCGILNDKDLLNLISPTIFMNKTRTILLSMFVFLIVVKSGFEFLNLKSKNKNQVNTLQEKMTISFECWLHSLFSKKVIAHISLLMQNSTLKGVKVRLVVWR